MATPSTRQAIVQAILKRRTNESYQREKKSMKGYVPSYLEGDEKCVVCGDKATGYHYKCITCEGCKGFFRRTVQKNLENSYQCKQSAQCNINKITRNQCQLCRYNKCISVGMAKDLVLDEEKRLAKRKLIEQNRELRRHKELSQMMAQCGWRIERPTDEERRLIHDVTQAFFQANDAQNKTLQTICREAGAAERFSVALTAAITNVVDFAKRIPLFVNHISTDDQVLILKVCCMEVITLRCVTSYKNMTKQLTLFPTVDVTKEQLRYTRLEPFCNSLFKLAEHMDSIDLTPVEIALLQAVIIFTADRPGISDRGRIDQAQDSVIRAFEHHLNEIWPHDPQYCPSLLMKLTEVRAISASLSDTLMSMRMDDPQELGRLFQAPALSRVIQGFPVSFAMQTPIHQHARGEKRPAVAANYNRHITNGFHRGVVRSFSQPVLNGHRSPQNFVPPVGDDDYDAWKTRRLDDLLNQCSGPSASDIPATTDVSSISMLSQRPCIKSGQSACESEFVSQNNDPNSGIHLPFLTGAYVNSKNGIVYETFRNNHNKIFQRISKSGTLRHDIPSTNNQALTPNQNIHFKSPPGNVDQFRNSCSRRKPNDIPQNTTAVEVTLATSFAAVSNSCTYPARLPLQLPRIIPHHSLNRKEHQTCVTYENQQLQRKEVESNRASVTDVSLRNNLIAAEILRMGLPMLLPYATGATGTRQELGGAVQSSKPQVAVDTGKLDVRTTQLKPANFGRPSPFVECVASNPNEMGEKPSQTSLEIPHNANSQEKQAIYSSFSEAARPFVRSSTEMRHSPSKRPISSPTFSQGKVKCRSPLQQSWNDGSAEGFVATDTTKHRGNDKSGVALTQPNSLFAENGHMRNKTLSDFEQVPHNDLQIRPKSY